MIQQNARGFEALGPATLHATASASSAYITSSNRSASTVAATSWTRTIRAPWSTRPHRGCEGAVVAGGDVVAEHLGDERLPRGTDEHRNLDASRPAPTVATAARGCGPRSSRSRCPGSAHNEPSVDPRGARPLESFDEEIADLGDDVGVLRRFLHRARLAAHVHDDHPGAGTRDDVEHAGIAPGGDVVDDGGAGVERGRGDGRLPRIDADRDPRGRRQAFDHRKHPAELLGFGHRVGTRTGRLAADVEHVGAGGHQRHAVRGRHLGVEVPAAVGEGVRGDVDDAHHGGAFPADRRPGEHCDAGYRSPMPSVVDLARSVPAASAAVRFGRVLQTVPGVGDQAHRLGPRRRVALEQTPHRGRDRERTGLLDPAHRHAEVLGFDHHEHTTRRQDVDQARRRSGWSDAPAPAVAWRSRRPGGRSSTAR